MKMLFAEYITSLYMLYVKMSLFVKSFLELDLFLVQRCTNKYPCTNTHDGLMLSLGLFHRSLRIVNDHLFLMANWDLSRMVQSIQLVFSARNKLILFTVINFKL